MSEEEDILENDNSFEDENYNPSKYSNLLQRAEDLSKHIKKLLVEDCIFENENYLEDTSAYDLSSDDETELPIENGLITNGKSIESYSSIVGKNLLLCKN